MWKINIRHPAKPRFASDVDTKKVGTVRCTSSVSKDKGNFRRNSIMVFLVLGLASCSSTEQPRLKGHVLGTISTSIYHVNLEDDSLEDELVYQASDVTGFTDSINYIYPDTIIFKEGFRIDKSNIIKYNLRTKEKTIIGNGIRPQYIKKINAIFYSECSENSGACSRRIERNDDQSFAGHFRRK